MVMVEGRLLMCVVVCTLVSEFKVKAFRFDFGLRDLKSRRVSQLSPKAIADEDPDSKYEMLAFCPPPVKMNLRAIFDDEDDVGNSKRIEALRIEGERKLAHREQMKRAFSEIVNVYKKLNTDSVI
jgi:hypothetical protein